MKNKKDFLLAESEKLVKLSEAELKTLADKSKEEKFEVQNQENKIVKDKYWVK